MLKMWFGLPLVAVIAAEPALAQNYNKNAFECLKQVGAAKNEDVRPSGDHLRMFRFYSETQHMAFMDCVARKAKEAPTPPTVIAKPKPAQHASEAHSSGRRCFPLNGRSFCE
jgi:hypothetical protein